MDTNKHYIRTDSNGFALKSFSDAFEQPLEADILMGEGGRHYNLDLWENFKPKYRYSVGSMKECTQEDIALWNSLLPPAPKSELQILQEKISSVEDKVLAIQIDVTAIKQKY